MRRCCGAPSSQGKLALENAAKRFAEIGMHAEAAQSLSERAKLSPNNPMIWNDLGVQYMAAGQPDHAHDAFLRAHKALPNYPLALYNLGRLAMERYGVEQARQTPSAALSSTFANEAIDYLRESLSQNPLLVQAHALLSGAYDAIGDTALARTHRQEASRLNPETSIPPKRTWLQKLPLLKKEPRQALGASLPFLSSSDNRSNNSTR